MRKVIILSIILLSAASGGQAKGEFIFGTPANLGPVVNSTASDGSPDISADGLTLYFDSLRPGGYGNWDIWVSRRESINDAWGEPEPLPPPVNSAYRDAGPSISADGLSLYFASDRPGGYGSFDIWVTTRKKTGEPWGPLMNLGPSVNSSDYDNHPGISADGLTLYFDSGRPSWIGFIGYYDLYMTQRATTEDAWVMAENMGSRVNTGYYELSPSITSDGLMLFFDRRSIFGDRDMWVATRRNSTEDWFAEPLSGPEVNTFYNDTDPSIRAAGSMLYFASDRPGGVGGQDLWQMSIASVRLIPDFNDDGRVDLVDFSLLAGHWLKNESSFDICPVPDGDGVVDYKDLAGLAEYWLTYPGVVAHWRLDEAEGGIAHDSAGGNNGTLHNGPQWRPAGGKINGALQFDGIDDYVSTDYVLNPNEGEFSVFVWIRGGSPGQVIISQANGAGAGRSWLCTDSSDGKLMTDLKFAGRWGLSLISQAAVNDGSWHHVGFVWDGMYRCLYVDGAEVVKDSESVPELESATGGLYFGIGKTFEAGTFWSGLIDDIRIYDGVMRP
jgi:Tol biopolymer transport system component